MSQENASTSAIALTLVLAAAVICLRLSIAGAVSLGAIFLVAQLVTLAALLAWLVGAAHLVEAFAAYSRGGTLVSEGMTDTAWSMAGTWWSKPSPTWVLAYYFTPVIVIALAVIVLYRVMPVSTSAGDARMGQLLGMIAAASSLDVLTMLRSDATHMIGSSMAIAPLVVLCVADLPGRLSDRPQTRIRSRLALAAVFLIVYPFLWSDPAFKIPPLIHLEELSRAVETLADTRHGIVSGTPETTTDVLTGRLGFVPVPDARCCAQRDFTYRDWAHAFDEIRSAIGSRSVYVDTRGNYSAFGAVASAVYFLGDFKVAPTQTDPMMSVWVDADVEAARDDLRRHPPDCLVTGGRDYLMTPFVLDLYQQYTEFTSSPPVSATVYCRKTLPH